MLTGDKFRKIVAQSQGFGNPGALAVFGDRFAVWRVDFTRLVSLNISDNPVGEKNQRGLCALAKALEGNQSLLSLDISACFLLGPNRKHFLAIIAFAESLHTNVVETFRCARNGIHSAVATTVGECVRGSRVNSIDLSDNRLGETITGMATNVGASLLRNELIFCAANLQELVLAGNRLRNEEAETIAEIVSPCIHLRSIDLSRNLIAAEGAYNVSVPLATNQSLTAVDLSGNRQIASEGARHLFDAIAANQNSACVSLNLTSTGLDHGCALSIQDLLKNNTSLTELNVAENCADLLSDPSEVGAINEALESNRVVQRILREPTSGVEFESLSPSVVAHLLNKIHQFPMAAMQGLRRNESFMRDEIMGDTIDMILPPDRRERVLTEGVRKRIQDQTTAEDRAKRRYKNLFHRFRQAKEDQLLDVSEEREGQKGDGGEAASAKGKKTRQKKKKKKRRRRQPQAELLKMQFSASTKELMDEKYGDKK